MVASRREAEGQETVRLVKEVGSDGFFVKTDMAKEAEVRVMVEKTMQAYDRLDYAFNNAGVEQLPTPLSEQTEEDFDRIININVKGVWLSMKYQIPQMLKNGAGAIVNMSSIAGLIGAATLPIYVASKHAVVGLTKSVALEYAKSGIRVNAVCPGVVQTPLVERFDKQFQEQMIPMHPIGRAGKPEEIAEAVVWLCSDKASFVIGEAIALDGGYVAQ